MLTYLSIDYKPPTRLCLCHCPPQHRLAQRLQQLQRLHPGAGGSAGRAARRVDHHVAQQLAPCKMPRAGAGATVKSIETRFQRFVNDVWTHWESEICRLWIFWVRNYDKIRIGSWHCLISFTFFDNAQFGMEHAENDGNPCCMEERCLPTDECEVRWTVVPIPSNGFRCGTPA